MSNHVLVPCAAGLGARRHVDGFTLLEMVVVLAIMALVIGMASVRIFAMIESWRTRSQLDDIVHQFAHLPVAARALGADIVLPPPRSANDTVASSSVAGADFRLPEDWKITFDKPLRVRSNGFCEGADILIEHGTQQYQRRVDPPFCQVSPVDGGRR